VKRILITDCEGPISKNDNAFELAEKLIPEGAKLFTLISKYDDVQAELVKRPGYKAGDTLKLILPFLKAYGATNEILRKLSAEGVLLVPGAEETLSFVRNLMPSFIVSTSYEQYIQALCEFTGFPARNTYCTKLDLDKFKVPSWEVDRLRVWTEKLVELPPPRIPVGACSVKELEERDLETVRYLDEVFWSEMQKMAAGAMIREVKPVGGEEKVAAVKEIIQENSGEPSQVIYVGDSITDSAPLRYIREKRGLAVSFNGNEYAIREAELAVISGSTLATSILAAAFDKGGKELVRELAGNWSYERIGEIVGDQLRAKAKEVYRGELPKVAIVSESNIAKLTEESCSFRKKVRGEAVGSLG